MQLSSKIEIETLTWSENRLARIRAILLQWQDDYDASEFPVSMDEVLELTEVRRLGDEGGNRGEYGGEQMTWTCSACGQRFTSREVAVNHIATHAHLSADTNIEVTCLMTHNLATLRPIAAGEWTCSACGRVWESEDAGKKHVRDHNYSSDAAALEGLDTIRTLAVAWLAASSLKAIDLAQIIRICDEALEGRNDQQRTIATVANCNCCNTIAIKSK